MRPAPQIQLHKSDGALLLFDEPPMNAIDKPRLSAAARIRSWWTGLSDRLLGINTSTSALCASRFGRPNGGFTSIENVSRRRGGPSHRWLITMWILIQRCEARSLGVE